ncbi:MAG: hypothetical protein ACD_73C00105G0002 [uncultured bacterium]|nr:MAG: hypothetical protein ACD_73C00105G0002 [uncultured bacterium]
MKFISKKDYNLMFGVMALVIILVFAILTITGDDGILRLMKLQKVKADMEKENRTLLEQNLAYRQDIKSLYQIPSIEARARESLGWVYPDEVIYVDSYQQ